MCFCGRCYHDNWWCPIRGTFRYQGLFEISTWYFCYHSGTNQLVYVGAHENLPSLSSNTCFLISVFDTGPMCSSAQETQQKAFFPFRVACLCCRWHARSPVFAFHAVSCCSLLEVNPEDLGVLRRIRTVSGVIGCHLYQCVMIVFNVLGFLVLG